MRLSRAVACGSWNIAPLPKSASAFSLFPGPVNVSQRNRLHYLRRLAHIFSVALASREVCRWES